MTRIKTGLVRLLEKVPGYQPTASFGEELPFHCSTADGTPLLRPLLTVLLYREPNEFTAM